MIAKYKPKLYREIHQFALENFTETLKYYHVTPDLNTIPDLQEVSDNDLPKLLDHDATRQLLHVAYGLILNKKDENGNFTFREEFFNTIDEREEEYKDFLVRHIGKHLDTLNL